MKPIWIILVTIVLSGCSTLSGSIGTGAAAGGAAGALIGNQSGSGSQRGKQTLQGAAIGAGIGALIGYAAHVGKTEKQKNEAQIKIGNTEQNAPSLSSPKIRRIWVPAEIQGEKYIDGHYMYVIEKTSAWTQ